MTTVRTGKEADFAAILQINDTSQPHVARLDLRELQRLVRIGSHLFVAESTSGIVEGYLIAFTHEHDYDGEEFLHLRQRIQCGFLYIDQVALRSESRGAGGGLHLYEAARQLAEARGLEKLCCEVNVEPPNPRSLKFHAKAGFFQLGTLAVTDGRTVVLLARDSR